MLSALSHGSEEEREAGEKLFGDTVDHRGSPADIINADPSGKALTAQAIALLSSAPDPRQVLQIFVDRFDPRIWSGSRAAILEDNATALDRLPAQFSDDLMPYVGQLKTQLLERAARCRRDETERDRSRDERSNEAELAPWVARMWLILQSSGDFDH